MDAQAWQPGKFLSAGLAAPSPSIPAPAPVEPSQPAPPVLPQRPRPRRWPFVLVLLILLVVSAVLWNARQQQAANQAKTVATPTAKAFRGTFERSVRVSGSIGAKNFAAIIAPRQNRDRGGGGGPGGGGPGGGGGGPQMTLIRLAGGGSRVKKGDVVAVFDMQWESDHADDVRADVTQRQAAVDKRRAEIGIENEAYEQQLRAARADFEKAQLDLRTAEVRSQIDAEKLKLAVEETEARYKQLQADAKIRQASQRADLRVLEIQVGRERNHLGRHTRNIENSAMRAPIDGLVVMQPIFRSGQFGQVQEGDQVAPGTYFMQIVDISDMVLNATVNQADSHLLTLGQKATIRLEAYPDLALPGRLISLGAMATSGGGGRGPRGARDTYVKQIPVRFAIEANDPRVNPDLSGSADVQLKAEENALQIPLAAVTEEAGKTSVRVRAGSGFQQREVQLGDRNYTHYVVLAGLDEGEEVALR
jgi:multidrug resistance efflux pump